jgi:hypothetical protein
VVPKKSKKQNQLRSQFDSGTNLQSSDVMSAERERFEMSPISPVAMRPAQAAEYLNLSEQRLAALRVEGRGPVFCKIGRQVSYLVSDLDAWLGARRRTSTSSTSAPEPIAA